MTPELLREAGQDGSLSTSNTYDQQWIVDSPVTDTAGVDERSMEVMNLRPGMRVLDLGCGTALMLIFLAREYDVEVWATDLWVDPTENWGTHQGARAEGRVHPIQADAHKLPFSHGFFDAIVSIGAYNYFGTGADYLGYCTEFLRPTGSIGVIAPGIRNTPGPTLPPYLAERWGPRPLHLAALRTGGAPTGNEPASSPEVADMGPARLGTKAPLARNLRQSQPRLHARRKPTPR